MSKVLFSPPNCPNHQDDIVSAIRGYLINVKTMTEYGSAMTAAEMSLAPVSYFVRSVILIVIFVSISRSITTDIDIIVLLFHPFFSCFRPWVTLQPE